jgi:hypothetical protein
MLLMGYVTGMFIVIPPWDISGVLMFCTLAFTAKTAGIAPGRCGFGLPPT